ncbi:20_t:CDS:1, partial [Scutellospora calospora]
MSDEDINPLFMFRHTYNKDFMVLRFKYNNEERLALIFYNERGEGLIEIPEKYRIEVISIDGERGNLENINNHIFLIPKYTKKLLIYYREANNLLFE